MSLIFDSSLPVFTFLTPKLPKQRVFSPHSSRQFKRVPNMRFSSLIASSEGADVLFLTVCQNVENAERESLERALVDV